MKRFFTRALCALGLLLGSLAATAAPAGAASATNTVTVKNVAGGTCLEMPGWTSEWGAQATVWGCNGGDNQNWVFNAMGGGFFQIVNRSSGLCLELPGLPPSTADGTRVQQWPCNGGRNQLWWFDHWGSGSGDGSRTAEIKNAYAGCLEINGWQSGTWGTGAQLWSCNGGANQRWAFPYEFIYNH
ncbi:RICIN domain-containing protein [Streptomyces sp. NPDC048623]|uniref:RICIN domain-containing protein n=1 Tax=Streptomyces sp. NPDC048623 TaxID=3155761 RepID=UPI00343ADAC9